MYISGYEDLIYGEDGHSPIKKTLEKVLNSAKEDKVRLRVEIRVRPQGVPTQRQESVFYCDPTNTSTESLMRVIVERMEDSPGPEFQGQIRLNFSQAGHSGEKYGSWTRVVRFMSGAMGQPQPGMGMNMGMPPMMRQAMEGMVDEDGEPIENSIGALNHLEPGMHMAAAQPVDNVMMRQWLETAFGFTFRSMAIQQSMFERATRMMESYTLRFGFPHPNHAGVVEVKGAEDKGGGGMGILPMLLNAAAHIAQGDNTEDKVGRAADIVGGAPPPQGAARMAAIQNAGRMIGSLQGPAEPAPPAPGFEPPPDDDGSGGGGGGAYYDDDGGSYDDDFSADLDGEGQYATGGPSMNEDDLSSVPPEDMKKMVIDWIRANPDQNKAAVMEMLPDLSKEVM
jgi:hypothetical protein